MYICIYICIYFFMGFPTRGHGVRVPPPAKNLLISHQLERFSSSRLPPPTKLLSLYD